MRDIWALSPCQDRHLVRDFCSIRIRGRLTYYDEYIDRAPSLWRWDGDGEDWSPVISCRG